MKMQNSHDSLRYIHTILFNQSKFKYHHTHPNKLKINRNKKKPAPEK